MLGPTGLKKKGGGGGELAPIHSFIHFADLLCLHIFFYYLKKKLFYTICGL